MSLNLIILLLDFGRMHTVYGELKEILPTNVPEPLGEYVTLMHSVDANLMHDMTTGKSVIGILHLH